MSMGYGAIAHKILEDENTVVYEYGGYNLNEPEYCNDDHMCDGTITIQKDCFLEPEIHEKLKKTSSGKKVLVTKRIIVDVDYEKYIRNGRIVVENCSNFWSTIDNGLHVDVMACRI